METELHKTYYIGICDDDPAYIQYAKELFLQTKEPTEQIIFYEYLSGEELLNDLKKKAKFDLLFLDVKLKDMDGHISAKAFRKEFPDSLLVFCSGVCLPTTESFETTPYRYLLKSYSKERMKEELTQILIKMRNTKLHPPLLGKRYHKIFRISLAHIEYIEIAKRGSIIHTIEDGEELIYTSGLKVSEHYQNLCDFGFAYAHNSYIVSLNAISCITSKELQFINGKKLSISRSHSKEFREKFTSYLAQKY